MSYITTTQLSARLGSTLYARLTDRVNGTTADAAVAQQIVDQAQALADSYLSMRYATPINLVAHPELSEILEARVLDLAEHIAWRASPFTSDIPDRVLFLNEEALRWFAAIARGELTLPATAPLASRTAENDAPRFASTPRTFTARELDGL
jgi:phage gp36-like protein